MARPICPRMSLPTQGLTPRPGPAGPAAPTPPAPPRPLAHAPGPAAQSSRPRHACPKDASYCTYAGGVQAVPAQLHPKGVRAGRRLTLVLHPMMLRPAPKRPCGNGAVLQRLRAGQLQAGARCGRRVGSTWGRAVGRLHRPARPGGAVVRGWHADAGRREAPARRRRTAAGKCQVPGSTGHEGRARQGGRRRGRCWRWFRDGKTGTGPALVILAGRRREEARDSTPRAGQERGQRVGWARTRTMINSWRRRRLSCPCTQTCRGQAWQAPSFPPPGPATCPESTETSSSYLAPRHAGRSHPPAAPTRTPVCCRQHRHRLQHAQLGDACVALRQCEGQARPEDEG